VAAALGVPFAQVVEPPISAVRVLRKGEGIRVDAETSDMAVQLLLSSGRQCSFEMYVLESEPGDSHEAGPYIDGAVEHLYVLEGRVRVGPEDALVEIGPGDCRSRGTPVMPTRRWRKALR
jgi:hypothetical protein